MGIRFSKSIKLGNYLRLNLSKSGVSASVGKKGASVTLSKRGTFLNLSPSLVGINGTGLSYRKKISANTIGTLFGGKQEAEQLPKEQASLIQKPKPSSLTSVLEEYERNNEARVHIHRYADRVADRETFDERIAMYASDTGKELYALCLAGDEDTIENFISAFLNNLDLPYDVRVNYELEDDVLHADLDLPEIEDLGTDYPAVVKGKITNKKKTMAELREEYAETVLSLGVFLTASFFNVSPTIRTVVLSGFTTVRDKNGDPVDKYLYSVRFTRDVFEKTDVTELEDLRHFYLQFENRINLSANHVFKAVRPFDAEEDEGDDPMLEEALLALTGLGFSAKDVRAILSELKKKDCDSTSAYVREGLKLLSGE